MSSFPLHLLRHGAPIEAGRLMGRTDGVPSVEGIAACVDQVEDLAIDAVISSDLWRAHEAACAVARPRALTVAIDARWRELDFGAWDGRLAAEIDGQALGRFWNDPDAHPPPDGERWSALVERVDAAIRDLASRPTLVATHAGAMRAVLAVLCGFDHRQIWAIDLPYAALLSLRVWPGERPSAQIVGLWP